MSKMSLFYKYLEGQNVRENQLKYYESWVQHFSKFCIDHDNDPYSPESLKTFRTYNEKSYETWQVDQATDAVKLYLHWCRSNEYRTQSINLILFCMDLRCLGRLRPVKVHIVQPLTPFLRFI